MRQSEGSTMSTCRTCSFSVRDTPRHGWTSQTVTPFSGLLASVELCGRLSLAIGVVFSSLVRRRGPRNSNLGEVTTCGHIFARLAFCAVVRTGCYWGIWSFLAVTSNIPAEAKKLARFTAHGKLSLLASRRSQVIGYKVWENHVASGLATTIRTRERFAAFQGYVRACSEGSQED